MRRRIKEARTICAALFFLTFLLASKDCLAGERLSLTIPSEPFGKNQRIAQFKVVITSGWVSSLPKLPRGWNICITKGPASLVVVEGGIPYGAYAEYVEFFTEFITIEKFPKEWVPFNVEIELVTLEALEAACGDKENIRPIILKMKDIVMRKIE